MPQTRRPADGCRILVMPTVGSTNALLGRLARVGAEEGLVLVARQQSGGRGRRGRQWHSPPGNLYMSILLKPKLPAALGGQIGFVAGLAIAETLAQRVEGRTISLKWPNDVLVDGRKISGLLPEAVIQGDRLAHIVVGIGVNLSSAPDGDVRWPTVALSEFGDETAADPVGFAAALTRCLMRWVEIWQRDGFEPVRAAWMGRAWGLGRNLTTSDNGNVVAGRFDGIDGEGALVLELPTGGRRLIRSGEVFPAEAG